MPGSPRTTAVVLTPDCFSQGRVRVPPGVWLSFQRYLRPPGSVGRPLPPSLGALPLGIGVSGELLVPLADDEACWIGLELSPPVLRLRLTLALDTGEGEWLDAFSGRSWHAGLPAEITLPGTLRIPGQRLADRHTAAFARPRGDAAGRLRLRLFCAADALQADVFALSIGMVCYPAFSAECGLPAPSRIDAAAGYKGWRLP